MGSGWMYDATTYASKNVSIGYQTLPNLTTVIVMLLSETSPADSLQPDLKNIAIGESIANVDDVGAGHRTIGGNALVNQNFASVNNEFETNISIGNKSSHNNTTGNMNVVIEHSQVYG